MPKDQFQIKKDLIQVADGLIETKEAVLQILDDENHGHVKLFIESLLNKAINRLSFITGRSQTEGFSRTNTLTPLKEFFGEELKVKEDNTAENLSPEELRKQNYIKKLDSLQNDLPTMSNEEVVDAYPSAEDKLVIRGLAKRAGLENYKDGEINSEFLDKIRDGLILIQLAEENKGKVEQKLVIANTDNDSEAGDDDLVK